MAHDRDDTEREGPDRVRLDKWLWAARFYKTRSIAVDAIDAGKVQVNGERAKRAKLLQVGNEVLIRNGPYEQVVHVTGLSERRGSATIAQGLYTETDASREAREKLAAQMRAYGGDWDKGKPTKQDRRAISRFRGKE